VKKICETKVAQNVSSYRSTFFYFGEISKRRAIGLKNIYFGLLIDR